MNKSQFDHGVKTLFNFILAIAVLADLLMLSVAINGKGASPTEAAVIAVLNLIYLCYTLYQLGSK